MSSFSLVDTYFTSHPANLAFCDLWWLYLCGLVVLVIRYNLSVPGNLRHLPRVSPYATLFSYARRESVDSRVKRLILPFARSGEGAVAVYMLGKWGVHIIDAEVRVFFRCWTVEF